MGRLHTLAAGTALLALRVKAQKTDLGCAALDTSSIMETIALYPQGPDLCLAHCNSVGYSYAGIQAQFCSCWEFSPVVIKTYTDNDHSDCSFSCDDPYATQYCGGIDLSTLGFLYNLYAGPAKGGSGNPSASWSDGGHPTLPSTSAGEVLPPTSSGPSGGGGPSPSGIFTTPGGIGPTPTRSVPRSSGTALPSSTSVRSTPLPRSSLPTLPVGPSTSAVLPSYTNTVYQTITSTITRCPVCKPEVTQFAVPIGTTCITAEVFTTPCEVTYTKTRPDGVVTPMVTTTISKIPYNPAESTIVVKTVDYLTTKYTTTLLVAVTRTVERVLPTGVEGPVQPPPPPPNVAYGTGASNGSQGAKPTTPVTAGASMDRFVEMFVLLSAVAFGALLML